MDGWIDGWIDENIPRANVIQHELPSIPFACARACLDRGRMPALSRFGRDQRRWATGAEERVDVLGYVRVCSFVNQERQAARRRGEEGRELRRRRRVTEDGQLSGSRERRRLVEDEAHAGVYA